MVNVATQVRPATDNISQSAFTLEDFEEISRHDRPITVPIRTVTVYELRRREDTPLKARLLEDIEHQWRIDHIPRYYENFKKRQEGKKAMNTDW